MKYIPTIYLCAAVPIISSAFYIRQRPPLTDCPTNWSSSKFLSGGELEYFEYWQYFDSICCEHSKHVRVQHSRYSWVLQPFRTFVLRVLLVVLGVLYYSSYSQYSQYLGLQYLYCSYSQHAQYLRHHILVLQYTQAQQYPEYRTPASTGSLKKKSIEHHTYEHVPCSRIMHRHTYSQ